MLKEGRISWEKLWVLMKEKGLNTSEIRRRDILSEVTLQKLRRNDYIGGNITSDAIASLCAALECQPGDIMQYVPNEVLKERGFQLDEDADIQ